MLFYILATLVVLAFAGGLFIIFVGGGDEDAFVSLFFLSAVISVPVVISWNFHADDIGTIAAQQEVISVYEKQRDDLNKTMASFNYPSGALLNADSPVRSIVEQLANVEKLLADARADKAKAIRSIEQRRNGPMSGVIKFVGDYK